MKPLKVGIAGLGTVGAGVMKLLAAQADLIAARAGRPVVVTAVSARDRNRDRGVKLDGLNWYDDAVGLAHDPAVDVVVELIGGAEGKAKALAEAAIAAGKTLVTANKALLAVHGVALAKAAEANNVTIAYEAAVAGGIPVIKALREGMAANQVSRVAGILNGTCNYILTVMREEGRDFADVLADAQRLGYAEADPSFDLDGVDAAHKLAILAGLAFGARIDFSSVHIEGIRRISGIDIAFAQELGYRIKLLGIAEKTEAGISLRVHPAMVPMEQPIATIDGVFNAVLMDGDFAGPVLLRGRGAGEGPTASAVVADLIDFARGIHVPVWGMAESALEEARLVPMSELNSAYFLRLSVVDQPGVLADVTAILRDHGISLESMLQRGRAPGEAVPIVLVTHETTEAAVSAALARVGTLPAVLEPPALIRIEPK
ncbi:homoserine dehydrogenase [Acidocella aminolytica 101 = DSM 11237]|uniref:Homoserine dehydrogenase n=2 Tax=Acidocella TaxID=50709 RepID=A0A0D6PDZ6_9PROT|nr:homoserine dehydrogenase [Acidocella aminolytica 101 = DSM 11237]GBQ35580.1 homoserine dehydrogenase [Acidocella aminolytica 101 = DSM 11237]SHE57649.1 homoserine dehydrogenase [Acidocella aminolytica 101 = DSM 11237]